MPRKVGTGWETCTQDSGIAYVSDVLCGDPLDLESMHLSCIAICRCHKKRPDLTIKISMRCDIRAFFILRPVFRRDMNLDLRY